MNNLQIELQRQKLKQQFLIMQELDNDSPQVPMVPKQYKNEVLQLGDTYSPQIKGKYIARPNIKSADFQERSDLVNDSSRSISEGSRKGKDLELQDTDNPEIKQGTKSNGVQYSVRTNRKRFFFPDEWIKFRDALETDNQKRSFDILINTGARINEIRHIKKQDIDFERGTLTIKVAKIKAKKGEKFPDPRTFKLSSQFLSRMKKYTKELKDDDYIYVLTDSALNLCMKKILEKIGIKDYKMFSVHNIRKTHGNWLVAHEVHMAKICKRLGHTAEVFLHAYASADIFNDKDREGIKEILGDLI